MKGRNIMTIDKILKTDDIVTILDKVHKKRADITNLVVIFEAPDKDGELCLTCYNSDMSNLTFCGILEWAKMDVFNDARVASEQESEDE
jgi:hypothetical protein